MTSKQFLTVGALALGVTLIAAPSLRAQDASPPKAPGTADHDGMGGMSGSGMADMMRMMQNCNRMMQSMSEQKSPQDPSGEAPPASPGQRG